jgi:hypothetical protein
MASMAWRLVLTKTAWLGHELRLVAAGAAVRLRLQLQMQHACAAPEWEVAAYTVVMLAVACTASAAQPIRSASDMWPSSESAGDAHSLRGCSAAAAHIPVDRRLR